MEWLSEKHIYSQTAEERKAYKRLKHLGDVTKIDGAAVEPVDVIIGGSPCQDLSVANGSRKGLDGERSSLFLEQLRIIKEMRENDRKNGRADEYVRCRWLVWENVCGAFSSNQGKDFARVLEETIKVVEPEIPVIDVPKGGWSYDGVIEDGMGRWSVAWSTHNAREFGVAQNRRRICLVADFNGMLAREILFESVGLYGHNREKQEERETLAGDSSGSSD